MSIQASMNALSGQAISSLAQVRGAQYFKEAKKVKALEADLLTAQKETEKAQAEAAAARESEKETMDTWIESIDTDEATPGYQETIAEMGLGRNPYKEVVSLGKRVKAYQSANAELQAQADQAAHFKDQLDFLASNLSGRQVKSIDYKLKKAGLGGITE